MAEMPSKGLPWMGLGLSSNLGPRDRPQPWKLLAESPGLFDFVEYSAPLDVAQAKAEAGLFGELEANLPSVPVIFHPVHLNLWGPELESRENLAALREHLEAVGSPWVGNDVGWWHHRDQPFPGYLYLAPPLTEAAVESCVAHARHVQAGVGVPLLLENPAVLARTGEMHVLDFLAALHRRTGAPLLLDLGHLLAYQLAHDLPADAALDRFPLEAVAEIHIAGGVITRRGARRFYVDDHGQPVREELFGLLESILPRCTGLRALTFEADGHPEPIARQTLERLRRLIPARRAGEVPALPVALHASAEAPALNETDRTAAWELFDQAHTERGAILDPEGMCAEADFRLAVLAQHLDRDWPLSRMLLAGSREALQSFAASPEYRALFDGTGRALPQAFASWARRILRERRGDAGGEAVLAFEQWAHGALARASNKKPEPGTVGLAPGVAVASFPLDLSELLFAAAALRRHLTDRAWVSGLLEGSGMEALGQVAARPARGPWPVVIRKRARLEVDPLEPQLLPLLQAASRGAAIESLDPQLLARAIAGGLVIEG